MQYDINKLHNLKLERITVKRKSPIIETTFWFIENEGEYLNYKGPRLILKRYEDGLYTYRFVENKDGYKHSFYTYDQRYANYLFMKWCDDFYCGELPEYYKYCGEAS